MSDTLDKKLHEAINRLNDKQKKAVLGIVKVFAEEEEMPSDHWKYEHFVAEMEDRYQEYNSGNAKLFSLDEATNRAREAVKKLKSKKASYGKTNHNPLQRMV